MNKRSIYIALPIAAAIFCSLRLHASDPVYGNKEGETVPVSLQVYYGQDCAALEPAREDNERHISQFTNDVRRITAGPDSHVDSLVIRAGASPEGSYAHNFHLANERGKSLGHILQARLPIGDSCIFIRTAGEDWEGFRHLVTLYEVPQKKEVLAIIDEHLLNVWKTDKSDTARMAALSGAAKSRLAGLDNGHVMDWICMNIYPYLRSSRAEAYCHTIPVCMAQTDNRDTLHRTDTIYMVPAIPAERDAGAADVSDTLKTGQLDHGTGRHGPESRYHFAIKTNLPADALLCPNIEVEFPVCRHFSLSAGQVFPWYTFMNDHFACQIMQSTLEWRWRPTNAGGLSGWFLGIYGSYGKGDLQWKGEGYQCQRYWSAGLSAGYCFHIGKSGNWRMEAGLSAGYTPVEYEHYAYSETYEELIRNDSGRILWIGPTALKCSLVWIVPSERNKNNKKQTR